MGGVFCCHCCHCFHVSCPHTSNQPKTSPHPAPKKSQQKKGENRGKNPSKKDGKHTWAAGRQPGTPTPSYKPVKASFTTTTKNNIKKKKQPHPTKHPHPNLFFHKKALISFHGNKLSGKHKTRIRNRVRDTALTRARPTLHRSV